MKRKTPAANERFCEMAGATRPKFCLTLQRQWLVRAAVKPATSQSRHHVGRKRGTACRAIQAFFLVPCGCLFRKKIELTFLS